VSRRTLKATPAERSARAKAAFSFRSPAVRNEGGSRGFPRRDDGQHRCSVPASASRTRPDRREAEAAVSRPRAPGILIGVGLGGFIDGIVLHQILQWHHLLSSEGDYPTTTVGGLEDNTLADGLFHAATWVAVAVGIWLFWRRSTGARSTMSGRTLFGWILFGWGLFNLVEGLVNHHILTLHHVREGVDNQTAYDLGFLALGLGLMLVGWFLARPRERDYLPRR
jgi:uncharacterized membrane protein